jgi:hypothetical protein
MNNSIRLLALAALIAVSSTAHALEATPPIPDIRCLIVGSRLGGSDNDKQRAAGQLLAMYAMARLDEFSAREIEDAMFKESLVLTPSDLQSETTRCGKILMEKGQEMTQIGTNLVRRGKEINDKQAAPRPPNPPHQ